MSLLQQLQKVGLRKYREVSLKEPYILTNWTDAPSDVPEVSPLDAFGIIYCWQVNLTLPEMKARKEVMLDRAMKDHGLLEPREGGYIRWVGGQEDPLSNFWIAPVEYLGLIWPSRECAMMAEKLETCGVLTSAKQFLPVLEAKNTECPAFNILQNGQLIKMGWSPKLYKNSAQMKKWVTQVINNVLRADAPECTKMWYSVKRFEVAKDLIWSASLTDLQMLQDILRPDYLEFRHFTSRSHRSPTQPLDHTDPWCFNDYHPEDRNFNMHGQLLWDAREGLIEMASRIWNYMQFPYYDRSHGEHPRLFLDTSIPKAARSLATRHYRPEPKTQPKVEAKKPSMKVSAPACTDIRVKMGLIPDTPEDGINFFDVFVMKKKEGQTPSVPTATVTNVKRELPEEFSSTEPEVKKLSTTTTLQQTITSPNPPGQEEGSKIGAITGSAENQVIVPKGTKGQLGIGARMKTEASTASTPASPEGGCHELRPSIMAKYSGRTFIFKVEGEGERKCFKCPRYNGGGIEAHIYRHLPWFILRTLCCPECELSWMKPNHFQGHFGSNHRRSPCQNSTGGRGTPPDPTAFNPRWVGLTLHFLRQLALRCIARGLFPNELGKNPLQLLLSWVSDQAAHWDTPLGHNQPGREFLSSAGVLRAFLELPPLEDEELTNSLRHFGDYSCLLHPRVFWQIFNALHVVAVEEGGEGLDVFDALVEPCCMTLGVTPKGVIKPCEQALAFARGVDCHFHPAKQEQTAKLCRPNQVQFTGQGVDGDRGIVQIERAVGCLDRQEAWDLLKDPATLERFQDARFNVLQIGLHPTLGETWKKGGKKRGELQTGFTDAVKAAKDNNLLSAIGEIGLDYFHPRKYCNARINYCAASREMLRWVLREATGHEVPLVLHIRESFVPESIESSASDDTLAECLTTYQGVRLVPRDRKIYLHSWNGSKHQLETWVSNFNQVFVGLSSILQKRDQPPCRDPEDPEVRKACSGRHPDLREVVETMDPSMYVLETDAGYQYPWYKVGKQKVVDYSCHAIWEVAQVVGEWRKEDPKMIILQARLNARRLWALRA